MDWLEAYKDGLSADLSAFTTPIPPWLEQLNWRHLGLFVVVAPETLTAAVPGLEIFSPSGVPCRIVILQPDVSMIELRWQISQLEDAGLPLVTAYPDIQLTCDKAILSRSITGSTDLVGTFKLVSKMGGTEFTLAKRFEVSQAPGTCTYTGPSYVVPGFAVPCMVTGKYSLLEQTQQLWPGDLQLPVSKDVQKSKPKRPSKLLKFESFRNPFGS